MTDISL